MNLHNYRKLSREEILAKIDKVVELEHWQRMAILDHLNLIAITQNKKPKKSSIWWRITIPMWMLFVCVNMFIVMPIKWLFTGHYQYNGAWRSRVFDIIDKWYKKMGL